MFKFKNSMSLEIRKILNRCRSIYDINALKSKVLANKAKATFVAVLAVLTIVCTTFAANYRVGYTVKVEDVVLGTVATKGEYYEVLDEVTTEVNNISEINFDPVAEESFSMEIVSIDSFTEKKELAENVKALSDGMVEAYTITKDGQFVVALHTEEDANTLKDNYLSSFSDEKYIEVSYDAEVLVAKSHVPEDAVYSLEEAEKQFLNGEVIDYTVLENDTIESIALQFNVTQEDILNDNEIGEITAGQSIKIHTGKPIIPIKTVEYINGNVDIPYEVEYLEDDSVYQGQIRVKTYGAVGKKYLNAYITKVNGEISEENIIEEKVISQPVTQVELIGTKEPPKSMGTGSFIMPTSGTLTSSFGRRWGRNHNGIDIGAKSGTPIYATDNGIIVESEYQKNGYGNIIKIDHQNGYVSYYAHCSRLYANVGDVVARGDLIAAVGNTGRSTGPHLHFEIRYNDVPKNPYNYIK